MRTVSKQKRVLQDFPYVPTKRPRANFSEHCRFSSMPTVSKQKRLLQDFPCVTTKRPRANSSEQSRFGCILKDCRIHVLSFLDENDLSSVAQVNRQFRDDSKHSSLSQSRTAIIECHHNSLELLIKKLVQMQTSGKFCRFHKIKLLNPQHVGKPGKLRISQIRRLVGRVRLTDVTSLDMSIEPCYLAYLSKNNSEVRACVPKALCLLLPNLRQVNMSNVSVKQSMLSDLARHCKHLESITCRCNMVYITGYDLRSSVRLEELLMDDSIFFPEAEPFHEPARIFEFCNRHIERVSIKNIRYYHQYRLWPVSQGSLIDFVRDTPNLKWFRSDLTPNNIALLEAERPEVTFVS
jgi:hypothetical protein